MRVISWNVNSVRARADLLVALIHAEAPDVIALQETKCSDAQFPGQLLSTLGYVVEHHGNGPGAGVCLASRRPLTDIQRGFGGMASPPFDEPRLVIGTSGGIRIATVYAPNGKRVRAPEWEVKLAWLALLRIELELELESCQEQGLGLLVIGDLNVCPTLDDVYDPVKKRNRNLVSQPERQAFQGLLDAGLTDVARSRFGAQAPYTWFSYVAGQFENDRGYRLDVALANDVALDNIDRCEVLRNWRDPKLHDRPSDHCPLLVDFNGSIF